MKVAVIGAGGFIGNRLVEQLHLGAAHEVVPIVRRPARLALPARFALDWRIADALDATALAGALQGCEAVVHAALGDVRQIEAMPAVLAEAAAQAGIARVVYLSTASVLGQAPEPGSTEDTPLHTSHALDYNNAKVRAEQSLFREMARRRLPACALRPGVVYGPRSRWITEIVDDLRTGRAWLYRDGHGICNGIYVDNLGAAVAAALAVPAPAVGAYLVGDDETVTWRDFYGALAAGLALDPAAIPSLDTLPAFRRSAAGRVRGLVARPSMQHLLPLLPRGMKSATKRFLAAMEAPAPVDAWRLPPPPAPRITEELAQLQQCRWKFPHDRAVERLGYQPRVSFPAAMDRTLRWLAFAEGRS